MDVDARGAGVQARVAFFGSTSLLAREMRGVLEARAFPAADVKLFDAAGEGALGEFAGEALVVTRPDEEAIAGLDVAFLCGSAADMAPYLDWPSRRGFTAIDLSGASLLRSNVPLVHAEINPADIAPGGRPAPLVAAPHGIAHNIATLAAAAAGAGEIRGLEAVALRPVSEMGEAGIDELQQQTVGLLNFSSVPRDVFGRQIAFNVVPSSGVDASRAEGFDERVRVELARLTGLDTAHVGLATAFVPVFHGHTIGLTLWFKSAVAVEALRQAVTQARGVRVVDDPSAFSSVDLAGEEAVAVAGLAVDPSRPDRTSLWSFCDNLRGGAALNAIRIAERVADLRSGLGR